MVKEHHVRAHQRSGHSISHYIRGHGGRFVHHGEYKGPLTTKERKHLPDHDFAVILADGTRKYPIDTPARARVALARVEANGNGEEIHEVREKVHKRYPSMSITGLLHRHRMSGY